MKWLTWSLVCLCGALHGCCGDDIGCEDRMEVSAEGIVPPPTTTLIRAEVCFDFTGFFQTPVSCATLETEFPPPEWSSSAQMTQTAGGFSCRGTLVRIDPDNNEWAVWISTPTNDDLDGREVAVELAVLDQDELRMRTFEGSVELNKTGAESTFCGPFCVEGRAELESVE